MFIATFFLSLLPLFAESDEEFVQWRLGDMAYHPTLTDDRPNTESLRILQEHYIPLLPTRALGGIHGKLRFRISPRSETWSGILVTDLEDRPLPAGKGFRVEIVEEKEKEAGRQNPWQQYDTKALFTDASRIFRPHTRLKVFQGQNLLDEVVIDFTRWNVQPSRIRMAELLDGPTSRHGRVTARDGKFLRDGRPLFFWGGHENHVPSKEVTDLYVEVYPEAGINLMRHLGIEESIVSDPVTGALDPQALDNYHYLVARLGEKGIYLFISHWFGYLSGRGMMYGYPKGQQPQDPNIWLDTRIRESWKKFLFNFFTAVNPYTGKTIKDDPTVIGFELSNETGLNGRRFDFNDLTRPEAAKEWRQAFNRFLLAKYGSRDALARAWATDPLRGWEDPAQATLLIPSHFRGARAAFGGHGQHDQFITGRFYRYGLPAFANPRFLDAIEFHRASGPRQPPPDFDYNNPCDPGETEAWRQKFNQFLLQKYGTRVALQKAWQEDPLFPGEDPARNNILIPTSYRCEEAYTPDLTTRLANPRISDALEFTYAIQKEWATDMARFLRNELGLSCSIGWNGDSFQVIQTPNHKANMDSPLDVTIAAAYLDWDNGDQLTSRTKNLKRFNTYGRIHGRPMFSYEWSAWSRQGPYTYEYILLAALLGRVYGFDAYAHHKMAPFPYPISDPLYSLENYIHPLSDRRRGAFCVARWILERSRIPEIPDPLIIGYPDACAFLGGPERKMSNPAFENWLLYQLGSDDYSFQEIYEGPADRVVVHCGHGPSGDYRKAKHAILWCHSNSDREGKDPQAKEKWFALHGIRFAPGQKYYLDDHYFATLGDMTEYVETHRQAEQARWKLLDQNAQNPALKNLTTAADYYWDTEPKASIPELDRQIYRALKRWGYPLPFDEEEIDKVWRSRDRSLVMDTPREAFWADRDDMQAWFGRLSRNRGRVRLSRLLARSAENQYSVLLLPWDTGDFKDARTLLLWTQWNSDVTVRVPFPRTPEVYAVNWLGQRLFKVKPVHARKQSLRFLTCRHDDIFAYEIARQPAP